MNELTTIVVLLGTVAIFNLDGERDYEVRLFPLSASKEQEVLGTKLLVDSARFSELEQKKQSSSLVKSESKEHQKLLEEWIEESPALTLRKLRAQIKGKDADALIEVAIDFGIEEHLLQEVDKKIEQNHEAKKK